MNFEDIFAEYYTIFRGQAVKIPAEGDREHTVALYLANNSIRKWDRTDGQLWNELWTSAAEDGSGDTTTLAEGNEYDAPKNMRKPPAFITVGGNRIPVVAPHEAQNYSSLSAIAYFLGSANKGYKMYTNAKGAGFAIDYPYLKKPTMMISNKSVPDMSDPNFMIQDMLASRFANERNSFGYRSAKKEANIALQNMKIENNSGTYGNASGLGGSGAGWGVGRGVRFDI